MSLIWQKLIAPTAAAGYSCNLTIGTFSGVLGFGTVAVPGVAFGSIDAEPIPGETLNCALWTTTPEFVVNFAGDVVSLVNGFDVYFNGVNYGGAGAWSFTSGATNLSRPTTPSETTGTYLLEIK
jgi:hypothetical protein